MANIYIVEDDTNIQEIEAIALKNSGHSVEQFDDAAHFYKKFCLLYTSDAADEL